MMRLVPTILLVAILGVAGSANAQFGVPWKRTPSVVVIGADPNDERFELVDSAIDFWNQILKDVGSAFKLPPATRLIQSPNDQALQTLSNLVLRGQVQSTRNPIELKSLPGDLRVVLGNSEFVSVAGPFDAEGKRVVAIRGLDYPPIGLPNVARNVIAHELGHAIGLGHNRDFSALMCGRPADCRPGLFRSDTPRMFPLLETERAQLLQLYPPNWVSNNE